MVFRVYPMSVQSCYRLVLAGRSTFVLPCERVHRISSLICSVGCCLKNISEIKLITFLSNCRRAFSLYAYSASKRCIYIVLWTRPLHGKILRFTLLHVLCLVGCWQQDVLFTVSPFFRKRIVLSHFLPYMIVTRGTLSLTHCVSRPLQWLGLECKIISRYENFTKVNHNNNNNNRSSRCSSGINKNNNNYYYCQ